MLLLLTKYKMGLDMYVTRRVGVSEEVKKRLEWTNVDTEKLSGLVEDAMYWRKANAIHNRFVENVQDGEDDCRDYRLSSENLHELLETINIVLASSKLVKGKIQNWSKGTPNGREPIMEDGKLIKDPTKAKELLPTTEGFFFGSTWYDEYYYDDLVRTKVRLEKEIANPRWELYYGSSR